MKPNTTSRQQSGSTYGPKFQRPGSSSNPHTNKTTNTGHPIGKYFVPIGPNFPNVQQAIPDLSNGLPPQLPQSTTGLARAQIHGDGRSQLPSSRDAPQLEPIIPPDSVSDSDGEVGYEDIESHETAPFEPETSYRPSDRGFVASGQFAGYAQSHELADLHRSTMQISRGPWLPRAYGTPPYQQHYRHNVIGLPQETSQQAPVHRMPYDPYRGGSLNSGALYSDPYERRPPQSQPPIALSQPPVTLTQGNTGLNLSLYLEMRVQEEINNPRPTLFNTLAKEKSMNRRVQIVESCENYDEVENLFEIALRHWEKQNSLSSLMLCMFALLISGSPYDYSVRQLERRFETKPPSLPLPLGLERLWKRCLARRDEINEKVPDPTLRNKVIELIGNHFGLDTARVRNSVASELERRTTPNTNPAPSLKRPRTPSSTVPQSPAARPGLPPVRHPK